MSGKPLVRIIIGSKSDYDVCIKIQEQLTEFGISSDFYVSSAHRNPDMTHNLAALAEEEGIRLIIACAGMAAHLPGVIASLTTLPVIGVPLKGSSLGGEDALYSIVQMPPGVPVATVAINGTKNAAILAMQILALGDADIKKTLKEFKLSLSRV